MAPPHRCDHCAAALPHGVRYCPGCGAVVSWHTPTGEAPAAIAAFLLVPQRDGTVRKDALLRPVLRIGRGDACEIPVDHPRVSRLHALLELRDGAWQLSDAKSSGGTFLNDRPVTGPVPLAAGDTIRLGRVPEESVAIVFHLGA
jgi:FHA domain-containing protein